MQNKKEGVTEFTYYLQKDYGYHLQIKIKDLVVNKLF